MNTLNKPDFYTPPEINEYWDVYVTTTNDPSHFVVIPLSQIEKLNALNDRLLDEYQVSYSVYYYLYLQTPSTYKHNLRLLTISPPINISSTYRHPPPKHTSSTYAHYLHFTHTISSYMHRLHLLTLSSPTDIVSTCAYHLYIRTLSSHTNILHLRTQSPRKHYWN